MKPFPLTKVCLLLHVVLQIECQVEIGTCGQLNISAQHLDTTKTRIADGSSATHHWPWHAAIYHKNDNSEPDYKCGGALISSKSVLTAAHCVQIHKVQLNVDIVTVSLGRLNLAEDESSARSFEVSEILVHPDYNMANYVSDIAVIRMSCHATFNNFVQPICLWNPKYIPCET